jgi:hypothetical protein
VQPWREQQNQLATTELAKRLQAQCGQCVSCTGLGAVLTVEGATETGLFQTYVGQVPVPKLIANDTVVMDNLSVHKAGSFRKAVEATGGRLLCLPTRSPDYSLIENGWFKRKAICKKLANAPNPGLTRLSEGHGRTGLALYFMANPLIIYSLWNASSRLDFIDGSGTITSRAAAASSRPAKSAA